MCLIGRDVRARFSQHIVNKLGCNTADGGCLDLVPAAAAPAQVRLVCVICNCHNGMPSPLEETEDEHTTRLEMLVYPDGTVVDRVCRFVHSKFGGGLSVQAVCSVFCLCFMLLALLGHAVPF